MIAGKTTSGFEFSISKDVFDDWEIIEMFKRQAEGDKFVFVELYPRVLGAEQFAALQNHVRTEDGRCPVSRLNDELLEIFSAVNAKK